MTTSHGMCRDDIILCVTSSWRRIKGQHMLHCGWCRHIFIKPTVLEYCAINKYSSVRSQYNPFSSRSINPKISRTTNSRHLVGVIQRPRSAYLIRRNTHKDYFGSTKGTRSVPYSEHIPHVGRFNSCQSPYLPVCLGNFNLKKSGISLTQKV